MQFFLFFPHQKQQRSVLFRQLQVLDFHPIELVFGNRRDGVELIFKFFNIFYELSFVDLNLIPEYLFFPPLLLQTFL
jgi:hypothetical protein